MKLPRYVTSSILSFLLFAGGGLAHGQTTLVSDTFSTSGALNGHVPDTTFGGAAWVARTGYGAATTANSVLTLPGQNQTDSLDLGANYFATHPGIYSLSASITLPAGSTSATSFGFGFVANPVTTGTLADQGTGAGQNPSGGSNSGMPWVYVAQAGLVYVNNHDANWVYNGVYANGQPHSYKLVLDTTQTRWVLTAYIDGAQVPLNGSSYPYTYTANPTNLRYVAICAGNSSVSASLYNFNLTFTPPTTLVSDTFSTSGALNGHVPDTTFGGAAWVARTGYGAATTANSVLTLPGQNQTDSLDLGANYFATHPGIYSLSASITLPAGSTSATSFGFGFVANPVTTGTLADQGTGAGQNPSGGSNSGMPWVYVAQAGLVYVNNHDANWVYNGVYANGQPHSYKLVLDTTQTRWVLTAYIDGAQVPLNGSSYPYTYTANPTNLRYVAICAGNSSVPASLSNFTLTAMYPVPALQADALVDSIGVNVNVWGGQGPSQASPTGPTSQMQLKLTAAGVRHARDFLAVDQGGIARDIPGTPTVSGAALAWQILGQNGIKMCFSICPEYGGASNYRDMTREIGNYQYFLISNGLVPYTELLESVNEPKGFYNPMKKDGNGNYVPDTGSPFYYGASWGSHTQTVCAAMDSVFAGDSRTANIPILAPPLAGAPSSASDHLELGDISAYVDYGNSHPYPGGSVPATDLPWELRIEQINVGSKPMIVTETGYHNALYTTNGHNPASEIAAGIYLPRLYLEYLKAGVRRTYLFQLFDNYTEAQSNAKFGTDIEAHFGLLRYDFIEKSAYTALKNLTGLLADPGAAFTPTPIAYSVSNQCGDVRSMLFQKRNGSYYLAIWRDVSVSNNSTRPPTDLSPTPTPVTVVFPGPRNASVSYPTPGTDPTPAASNPKSWTNVSSVQLNLGGQVAILQF